MSWTGWDGGKLLEAALKAAPLCAGEVGRLLPRLGMR
jgi:hypothetical protein